MDFKSLISKIESIDGKIDTPKAPQLAKSVQLNEDAQLRVLSGRTTYVAEAKKKAEEDVKEADDMKVGDKKNIATGTVEKTKTGIVHKSSKAYGGSEEKEADDEDKPKKKAKKESVEPEFKSKFMKMYVGEQPAVRAGHLRRAPLPVRKDEPHWPSELPIPEALEVVLPELRRYVSVNHEHGAEGEQEKEHECQASQRSALRRGAHRD
jgi:hypothetical protein